jgi:hypothetical protein
MAIACNILDEARARGTTMAGRGEDGSGLFAVTAAALLGAVTEPREGGDLAVNRTFSRVAVLGHAQRLASLATELSVHGDEAGLGGNTNTTSLGTGG